MKKDSRFMLQYGKDCMNRLRLVVIFWICLILLPVTGWAADDGYGYPIHGSYEATILGTPDNLKLTPPDKISDPGNSSSTSSRTLRSRMSFFTIRGCAAPWPISIRKRRWFS